MTRTRLVLEDFLPYRLSFTGNLVSQTMSLAYGAPFDLTVPEWRLLAVIAESDGVTQAEIALRTRMDKVTVSRAAMALKQRGMVDTKAHPDDKRSHLLLLTPSGTNIYEAIVPKIVEIEQKIFAEIDPGKLSALFHTLREIDAAALAARIGD